MKIEDIDRVKALSKYRERAVALRDKAFCSVIGCNVDTTDIFSVIPAGPIRQAIVDACNAEIQEWESELTELGVEFVSALPAVDPRAED